MDLTAAESLMPFFHDRLKVWLRDRGIRHDLVSAVIRQGSRNDDLNHLCRLAETLASFMAQDDGAALLAGYKRASNILAAEKKEGRRFDGKVDPSGFRDDEEIALHERCDALAAKPVADTDTAIARMRSGVACPD